MPADEEGTIDRPRLVTRTFVLVTLSSFGYFIAIGMTFPVLPLFVEGPLRGRGVTVGLAVGAFSASAFVLRPFLGGLGDRRGRRRLLVGGGVIVGLSIAGYSLASSLIVLVLFRLVTGVGEAMFFVSAAGAVNDLAPDDRRGEAVSLFSLSLYGGFAIGPVLGEAILRAAGFDEVWFVAAGLCAAAVVLAALVPETRARHAGTLGRARLYHRAGLLPGLVLLTSVWGFAGFSSFVALYSRRLGMSDSGLAFLTYAVIVLGIRSIGARIPDIVGPARTARAALGTSAVGLALIAALASVPGLFIGTVVFAIGQGLGFPALMTLAVAGAPASDRGAVIGTFTAFFDLAYAFGAISLGSVADALGYRGVFFTASGAALAGLVTLTLTRKSAARASTTTTG